MKTLYWTLLGFSGWLTVSALVQTIDGYALFDTFRLHVVLAVTYLAICIIGAVKIVSIGKRNKLAPRLLFIGLLCVAAAAAARSAAPSARTDIIIALTLCFAPYLILLLRGRIYRCSRWVATSATGPIDSEGHLGLSSVGNGSASRLAASRTV